jgi:A/G-specific adenine glycosylase
VTEKQIKTVQAAVLAWYKKYGRHDLPWRNLTKSKIDVPYGVMVSEFMLQQTQVERVLLKFKAFVHIFPTIKALADATPAKVITLWSGLGYNRRAVMLHTAAKEIANQYDGVVPSDLGELQNLAGIGPYTASAIVAFGFNQPVTVLDTNIERFYELLFFGYAKPAKAELHALAARFVPPTQSRNWHSALMDLMTVVRRERTPSAQQAALIEELNLKPDWKLPKLGALPLARPKQSKFAGSERYFRGQIIAFLRDQPEQKATFSRISKRMAELQLPEKYSVATIVAKLKKDKLIAYREPLASRSIIRLP